MALSKIDQTTKDRIIEEVKKGNKQNKIVMLLGISSSSVSRIIEDYRKLHPEEISPPSKFPLKKDYQHIVDLRKGGASYIEIANNIKCSMQTVYIACKKNGLIKTVKRQRKPKTPKKIIRQKLDQAVRDKVIELAKEGKTQKEIGRMLQIGQTTVSKIVVNYRKRHPKEISYSPNKMPIEVYERIIELRVRGKTYNEIAEIVPCSFKTVLNACKRYEKGYKPY